MTVNTTNKVKLFDKILDPFVELVAFVKKTYKSFFQKLTDTAIESIGWIGVATLHVTTIPTLIALQSGLTDETPSIDSVLMLWTALTLLFLKALLKKDMVTIFIITLGFIIQSILMALIFFK